MGPLYSQGSLWEGNSRTHTDVTTKAEGHRDRWEDTALLALHREERTKAAPEAGKDKETSSLEPPEGAQANL